MPVRIPIKIFRLKQTQPGVFDLAPTRFVQGVDSSNIVTLADGTKIISIDQTPANQPLADKVNTIVYTDKFGDYVILDNAEKLYILSNNSNNTDLNANIPTYFEFYVNPQRLSPTYQKIQSETRTRGGWEIQHWGDALTELRVEGKSGGMHRIGGRAKITRNINATNRNLRDNRSLGDGLIEGESVTDSLAWKRLVQLKQLYDIDHSVRNQDQLILIGMAVYDSFYVGYFTQFAGPNQEANDPYQLSYSFTIKVLTETSVSTVNPLINEAVTNGTENTYTSPQDLSGF